MEDSQQSDFQMRISALEKFAHTDENSQLSRFNTARGSSTGPVTVGPTKLSDVSSMLQFHLNIEINVTPNRHFVFVYLLG